MKPRFRRTAPTQFEKLPDLVTPEEAGAYLRLSKNAVYARLRDGSVDSIRFGRLIRIPKSELLKK